MDEGSMDSGCGELDNEVEAEDYGEERELVRGEGAGAGTDEVIGSAPRAPRDAFRLVYVLFYLFGITSLVPWNFIITANDYWMYKFRDLTPKNGSISLEKTQFQAEFISYLNIASAVPNLLFLIINSMYGHLVPLRHRLLGSLALIASTFLLTTALVQVDTDQWQDNFFIITLVTVVFMTGASAVFIGGLYGVAGRFSEEYMAAVLSGQSLGGVIAAVAQILSLAFRVSPQHSALVYFCIADLMVLLSLLAYALMYRIPFFKHHVLKGAQNASLNRRQRNVSLAAVLRRTGVYAACIFLVFAVTMAVYPAVTVNVQAQSDTRGTDWNSVYFVPVVNYLIFNCGDYAGRLTAAFLLCPSSQWVVLAGSVLRAAGIPLLMLCNAQPRHLPVLFPHDYQFIAIMIVFAFSNGYLTNITFINSARSVQAEEREKASSVLATLLSLGLCAGAASSVLLVRAL